MKPYKRMSKGATLALFTASMIGVGGLASIGLQTYAQTSNTQSSATHAPGYRNHDNERRVVLPSGGITEAQARTVVTTQYPSLTIRHIRLEDEDGVVVYSVKLSDNTEVNVDAVTSVLTPETDIQESSEHQKKNTQHKKDDNNDDETQDAEHVDGSEKQVNEQG